MNGRIKCVILASQNPPAHVSVTQLSFLLFESFERQTETSTPFEQTKEHSVSSVLL